MKGTVKWFDPTKGYGFIKTAENEGDVFVHISALQSSGLQTLDQGQEVNFDIDNRNGKVFATNLRAI
jgi:CspA family cold shock protein